MDFYNVYQTTCHNGKQINSSFCGYALLDNPPQNKIYPITWENLEEWYSKHGENVKFCYLHKKMGRQVKFFSNGQSIKEWREPNLNITVEMIYEQYTPSIQKILMWHDGEKAIKYLIEKGLTIANLQ